MLESPALPALLGELLHELLGPVAKVVEAAAPFILRRVREPEENAEIRVLARAGGNPLHVVVAFNVMLDILLGCTSGAARVFDAASPASKQATRMLHFRTLDWAMDVLRQLTVELDFVRHEGGPVIATSVTYLGYVGVLTGVRKGLSLSLNFRPYHAQETWKQALQFRWHQAMVVLGFRKSISSVLRGILLDEQTTTDNNTTSISLQQVEKIISEFRPAPSTSAYLTFCTPSRVFVVEKDNYQAKIRESDLFLYAVNHDEDDEGDPDELAELASQEAAIGMEEIVRFSRFRQDHLEKLWIKKSQTCQKRTKRPDQVVSVNDVIRIVSDPEISNEQTHYAVVMDPLEGKVRWAIMYPAADDDDDRDDGSLSAAPILPWSNSRKED